MVIVGTSPKDGVVLTPSKWPFHGLYWDDRFGDVFGHADADLRCLKTKVSQQKSLRTNPSMFANQSNILFVRSRKIVTRKNRSIQYIYIY